MARLSKDEIVKQLTELGVEYDANAEYGDLAALLKASKPAETETETPVKDEIPTTAKAVKSELGVMTEKPKIEVSDMAKLERKIRYYVKKDGGFVKGLKPADIEMAKALLEKAGRKEPKWDISIKIAGYDV